MSDDDAAAILELERRALDRWAQRDTAGYIANYADDVTQIVNGRERKPARCAARCAKQR
jgi:hypothetical protein